MIATVPFESSTQDEDRERPPDQAVVNVIVALIKSIPKFEIGTVISRQPNVGTSLRKETQVKRVHVYHQAQSVSNTGSTGPGRTKKVIAKVVIDVADNLGGLKDDARAIYKYAWLIERQITDNPQIYRGKDNEPDHELAKLLHPDMVWRWMDVVSKEFMPGLDENNRDVDMVQIVLNLEYNTIRGRPLG